MLIVETPVTPAEQAVETTPAEQAVETTPALPVALEQAQAVLAAVPGMAALPGIAQAQAAIAALSGMAEEVVIATARRASQWMLWAYIIRGACAAELLARQPRLVGGRGKKDVDGQGRQAQMAQIAIAFEIEPRTLADDVRIYERFFAPRADGSGQSEDGMEDTLARYSGLGRDHFRAALAAPDPLKIIEAATGSGEGGVCSVRQLRAVVQANKNQGGQAAAGQPDDGLVFDVEQCLVSDPLSVFNAPSDPLSVLAAPASAVSVFPNPAATAGTSPWEEVLGEETAALLRELVARHNAAYADDAVDAAGFIRRLVQQAARQAEDSLTAEVDMSAAPVFELTLA